MSQQQLADEPVQTTGSSKLKIATVLGFILTVVFVECGVAFFVFPSEDEIQAMARQQLAFEGEAVASADNTDAAGQVFGGDRVEVEMGSFGVTSYQPLTNTTLRIDFTLFGTCHSKDQSETTAKLAESEHRYREQVLVILRAAEMTDLTDAGLGLIKRKILEKTNRTIGKPLLQEVVFSEFSFIEQ